MWTRETKYEDEVGKIFVKDLILVTCDQSANY